MSLIGCGNSGSSNTSPRSAIGDRHAAGGYLQGVDPTSRDLLNASEATRGLLRRQDAAAWHQPAFRPGLKPGASNLADIDIGPPLTTSEAEAATEAMAKASGSYVLTRA
jgi:hypothetical protein